jgi:hypothetical protein
MFARCVKVQLACLVFATTFGARGGDEPVSRSNIARSAMPAAEGQTFTETLMNDDRGEVRRRTLAASNPPTVDALLDWAERTYAQFFPGHKSSQAAAPYVYRYYPETGNYVGVDGSQVVIFGPVSGGVLQNVGQLSDFTCLVSPQACVVPRIERVAASHSVSKFVLPDGRVGLLGEETYPVKYSGLVPGSVVKIVDGVTNAVSIRSSNGFLSDRTVVLTAEGDVFGWGEGKNALGQPYNGNNKVTTPVKIAQLSNVVDVSLADGNMTMALRTDGTVWALPAAVYKNGLVQAARITGIPTIKAIFPVGSGDYEATIAVDESGQAWSIKRGEPVQDPANSRTIYSVKSERMLFAPSGIQQIACTGTSTDSTCLAVVADGSVKAWGKNNLAFGDGTTQDSTLPVNVKLPANERVRKLSIQRQCALALTETGKLYFWGLSNLACYYFPDLSERLVPSVMYSGIVEFAVNEGSRIVAVAPGGEVFSWGRAGSESLGDGRTSQSTKPIRVAGIILN